MVKIQELEQGRIYHIGDSNIGDGSRPKFCQGHGIFRAKTGEGQLLVEEVRSPTGNKTEDSDI